MERIHHILDYSPHNGIYFERLCSPSYKNTTYRTRSFFLREQAHCFRTSQVSISRKFYAGHSNLPFVRSSSTFHPHTAHDVVSCPSSDLSVCPFFFSPIASTIHPRALIEARTAGAGYREKKKISSIRPSSGDLCTRCMIDTRWRCPDVARLVGRSAVQKARTREKRCDTWTDGQMGRQADRK